jgi:hypothetical protein
MTNSGTTHSQSPLHGIKLGYTPLLLFLLATFVAPYLALSIVIPFMRTPDIGAGSDAYRFNDALIRDGTILTVAALTFGVSYFMTSFEQPSTYFLLTHLRQTSLLWVYLVLNVVESIAQARSHWIVDCYGCSFPWSWFAPPALAGNLLALAFRSRRTKVAA